MAEAHASRVELQSCSEGALPSAWTKDPSRFQFHCQTQLAGLVVKRGAIVAVHALGSTHQFVVLAAEPDAHAVRISSETVVELAIRAPAVACVRDGSLAPLVPPSWLPFKAASSAIFDEGFCDVFGRVVEVLQCLLSAPRTSNASVGSAGAGAGSGAGAAENTGPLRFRVWRLLPAHDSFVPLAEYAALVRAVAPRGILLHGTAGCGATSMAVRIGQKLMQAQVSARATAARPKF